MKKIDYTKIPLKKQYFTIFRYIKFCNKSLKIGYIEKNSPADHSGLLVGDKIISINNSPVINWNDIVSFIKANPSKILELNILRNNH